MNFFANLSVIKLADKLPVHKSSPLTTLSLSLHDPPQYYPTIHTYLLYFQTKIFNAFLMSPLGTAVTPISPFTDPIMLPMLEQKYRQKFSCNFHPPPVTPPSPPPPTTLGYKYSPQHPNLHSP
jgi:hypothetical protein